MVEKGSYAMHVAEGGLDWNYWLISLAFGVGSLPVQQIINLWYSYGQKFKRRREKKRLEKDGQLTTRHLPSSTVHA